MTLKAGDLAPDFALPDQDGTVRRLADYAGRTLLLYFYPKDDTPGCTTEACAIRDRYADFGAQGVAVLGVSADSPASHARFAGKYALPFPLLSDPDHGVLEAYGVWQEKRMMGRTYMGIVRQSFLVGPDGRILKAYPQVKPAEHAEEVIADAAGLSPAA